MKNNKSGFFIHADLVGQLDLSKIYPHCNDFLRFTKISELFTDFSPIFSCTLFGHFKIFCRPTKSVCVNPT